MLSDKETEANNARKEALKALHLGRAVRAGGIRRPASRSAVQRAAQHAICTRYGDGPELKEKTMMAKFTQWWHGVTKGHSFTKITDRTKSDCGFEDYKCTVCGAVESRFHN
jgi:hypothetical protein